MRRGLRHGNWWQRHVVAVIAAQLRQGVTPEKVALAVAIGGALAVFPVVGTSTVLCVGAGLLLRLNQPIMLLMNALGAPVQLALLIPFYRAAEWIGAPHLSLSIPALWVRFREVGIVDFFRQFGVIALGGIGVWAIVAPPAVLIVYLVLRPLMRALSQRRA